MARLARLLAVSAGVGTAVWLLPASIHIIGWHGGGAARVALLPSLWKLAVAVVACVAGGVTLGAAGGAVGEAALMPFGLLWLWALPYVPWIPDRAPALLALAGPLRWAVAAIALSGSAAALAGARRESWWRPGRATVFALSLALYLGFGLWSASEVGPGADEPHYLVITQSLLRDHDLDIENNHARGDYREYFGGELKPDFLKRGRNDVIYSIHAPGLPALVAPAFAVAGYRGAVAMVCLFGALAALAVFELASLIAGPGAALAAWAAVCLTVPFVPHAWLIFPEMAGAMLVAWAALWLYAPLPERMGRWIWRGAALGLLPWLHTKFVILLAAMIGALALRLWRRPKMAAALIAPAAISGGLWILSFYALYGSFDPQIPYGDFPKLFVLASNIPRGVLGLLFDQKFGLLWYAPVYLAAIAGAWWMVRSAELRLFALTLLGTVAVFVASTTRMYMWWGGSSAPARFLVPVLPLLAPMIAVAFQRAAAGVRAVFAVLLGASVAIGAFGVWAPHRFMLFSSPHGLSNFFTAVQGSAPLTALLPIYTEDVVRWGVVVPWLAAALVTAAVLAGLGKLAGSRSPFTLVAAGVVSFALVGAALAGTPASADQRRAAAIRGRLELLAAIDSPLRGLDYVRQVRLTARQTIALGALTLSRAVGELSDPPRQLAGPYTLPPGRYSVHLLFAGGQPRPGATVVELDDSVRLAAADDGGQPLPFEVPVEAPVWIDVPDRARSASVQAVELVPEDVVPRSARPGIVAHFVEAISGREGAFLVYADDSAYHEGGVFWTIGTEAATVAVVPNGASVLRLTLHVGPTPGRVRLVVGGVDRSMTLTADQTQFVEVALPPDTRLVPIEVRAPGAFRPSEHEPGSRDTRSLGVQVRVAVR